MTEGPSEPTTDAEGPAAEAAPAVSAFEAALRAAVAERALEVSTNHDELQVRVGRDDLVGVCRTLKETPGIELKYLRCLSIIDWAEDNEFEAVYHLASLAHRDKVIVRVRVGADDPWLPTVMPVWSGADWHEREGHDLFGIEFRGHPNMSPLILYEGFEGFPGRKSYPMPEQVTFYGGD